MGFFDSAPAPAQPATPSTGASSVPTPALSTGGFFGSVSGQTGNGTPSNSANKAGFFSSIPTPTPTVTPNADGSIPSPYWQGADHQGDTFGPSKTLDPSGRPLLDYKPSGAQSTTTDMTRTDTVFNPMTAQPEKQTDIATPRTVSSSEKAQIKENAGAPKSDVIDHAMALTVAGSNEPENLRPETNDLNSQQGTFETDLDKQVYSGKISLFDAQKLEVANKNLPTPFTGTQSPSFWDNVKGYLDKAYTIAGDATHAIEDTAASVGNKLSYGMGILGSWLVNKSGMNNNDALVAKETIKALPSSIAENLPFGVGDIVKQIEADPQNSANLSLSDVIQSLPQAGKDFVSGMVAQPALTIAGAVLAPFMAEEDSSTPGQLTVNIPGLGQVSNLQAEVAQKVNDGENPWQAAAAETPNAIFDTLAVVGLAGKFLAPREVTILEGEATGVQAKNGPQSFREYKPAVSNTPIPNDILQKIAEEKGIDLSKTKYDPTQPTFFRLEGDAQGKTATPSIVQIQPSWLDTFLNKFGGNASAVPPTAVVPLYQQPVKLSDIVDKANDMYQTIKNTPNKQGGFVGIGKESPSSYEGEPDLTIKTLQRLEGKSYVSKQYISDLTNNADLKQTEKDTVRNVLNQYPDGKDIPVKEFADKVKAELLPLTRNTQTSGRYESISLPEGQRGDVANYSEHVYSSPIGTSAGNIHFSDAKGSENYFGHTRVEDMAGSENGTKTLSGPNAGTRRVIELQSDLYQKGNLDRETGHWSLGGPEDSFNKLEQKLGKDELKNKIDARNKDVDKLRQYNNPTAHFRMVREEVKQAAIDGKTKLQFPTGETAMKIEGLGGTNHNWQWGGADDIASRDNLTFETLKEYGKVGETINDGSRDWIITDILGDGKFRAIQLNDFNDKMNVLEETHDELLSGLKGDRHSTEEFDISGKGDTNNPIYKFYEKDLARYLKNNYDAKLVTDKQGVTWNEVNVKPEVAKQPVQAFKAGTRYYALGRGPKIDIAKVSELLKEIVPKENIKYVFNPDLLKENKALGMFEHNPRMEAINPALKPVINLFEKNGQAYVKPAFHEAYHYLENKVFSPEKLAQLNKETLAVMNEGDHQHYIGQNSKEYNTPEKRASEYRADEFAKEQTEKAGYKSSIHKILDIIRSAIQKIIDVAKSFKAHLDSIPNKQGGFVGIGFGEKPNPSEEEFEHISSLISTEHSPDVDEIDERAQELGNRQEALKLNPASQLSKYANKRTGELPEVTGNKSSIWARKGDDISTELGFKDSEEAREAYKKYATDKKSFDADHEKFKDDKKALIRALKESDAKNTSEYEARFNPDITEANKGVVPPEVRGGIHAPEMVLKDFIDKAALTLGRDTLERNIEKVVPQSDQPALKKFLIDPVRENETDRVRFNNDLRKEIAGKMKELGIKRGSKEDQLTQRFGEGMMTKEDLVKALPNTWKQVESASDYFRKTYDSLIDKWNEERAKFNYKPVGKHDDYFRHFQDINQFTNSFGFLRSESQLPTEIAGKTADFKPGKQFTNAELKRTGHKTSYTAIGGMDNYLDSVTKQIYHIDSIQRGRAMEKYIREVAKKSYDLNLPNFVSNIQEWTNLVAGKAAMLDRAIESTVGRPIMKFMNGLSNLIARNIIGGNISVALTHLVSTPLELATTDKVPMIQGLMSTLVSPLRSEPITHIDGQESSFLTRRFPKKYIQPTKFDNATNTLNWLFKITDEFKSKLTVAGKYYEGIKDGLSKEDAMKAADEYAGRIIGDYSVGNRPNLMNTHTTKLLAQFQLGVNDSMSVLMHDIPHWEKGNKAKIAYRLAAFAVFSYLFNQVYKQIRGSGKGLDPIDLGLTITGLNEEGAGQDLMSRLKLAGSDLAGELPFTSIAAGSFPLATAFGQPLYNLITGAGPRGAAAETLASNLISPVGGGGQAVKTFKGIEAVNQGKTVTSKGTTNTTVEPSIGNYVKGAIFGPSAFNNANGANHDTTNLINLLNAGKGQATVEAEATYNQMKNSPDAAAQFNALLKSNPALAKNVEQVAKDDKSGITLNERLVKALGVVDGSRAKYIANQINNLPDKKSKSDLWERYVTLKIISPQVASQLGPLINK